MVYSAKQVNNKGFLRPEKETAAMVVNGKQENGEPLVKE
jgi:hypothetical protein